jgi:hypothetical protein
MKIEQLKMNVDTFILNNINNLFPNNNLTNKLLNSTVKIIYNQKRYMIYNFVDLLGDENGNVDSEKIMNEFETNLFEDGNIKIHIDEVLNYFGVKNIPDFLSNKILIFNKEEIKSIFITQ